MNICEDCIKNDVCKYRAKVEKYEQETKLPAPLEPEVKCRHKRTEPISWTYVSDGTTTTKINCPSTWRDITTWPDVGNDLTLTANT